MKNNIFLEHPLQTRLLQLLQEYLLGNTLDEVLQHSTTLSNLLKLHAQLQQFSESNPMPESDTPEQRQLVITDIMQRFAELCAQSPKKRVVERKTSPH